MSSIFLCHSSIDKPFVEKLAKDLKRLGIQPWVDKWEIKVGDSLLWKINEGIRENDYLGVVLSPDALRSHWVKSEIGAAWSKQMEVEKVVLLPILYRQCDIPIVLRDKKYADFSSDYQTGLTDLALVFGLKEIKTINEDNWRLFVSKRASGWQNYRTAEYIRLVHVLVDRAREYNWSTHSGGSKNPFSLSLHAWNKPNSQYISIRLDRKTFAYKASLKREANPNNLRPSDYDISIGTTVEQCEEFVWRHMEDFRKAYGDPTLKADHALMRRRNPEQLVELTLKFMKQLSWYQGEDVLL